MEDNSITVAKIDYVVAVVIAEYNFDNVLISEVDNVIIASVDSTCISVLPILIMSLLLKL